MALLDFLKNKKEKEKAKKAVEKKPVMPAHAGKASVKKDSEIVAKPSLVKAAKEGFSYTIIKEPHISEKATDLAEKSNKYTFRVYDRSNKLEIKKSVEGIYGVNVLDVNMIKIPHKKRRLGRTQGFKKAFTKAVVTIKEGQKIEIF